MRRATSLLRIGACVLWVASAAGCSALYSFDFMARDAGPFDAGPSDAGVDGGLPGCDSAERICDEGAICFGAACDELVRVEGGLHHTCALGGSGRVYCWGSNGERQLGEAGPDRSEAALVGLPPGAGTPVDLAVGDQHACVVTESPTPPSRVYCWGANGDGRLGFDGTANGPIQAAGADGASQVACGGAHSCAIVSGEVRCWGRNTLGQLGTGDTAGSSSAARAATATSDFTAVYAAGDRSCAIDGAGALFCWGDNVDGELAVLGGDRAVTPGAVQGLPAGVSVAALGRRNACAIVDGALYCWGSGAAGQLGRGTTDPATVAHRVDRFDGSDADDFVEVAVGHRFVCAVRAGGTTYCWGDNDFSQLGVPDVDGDPATFRRLLAESTPFEVTRVGAGERHLCGAVDGRLACWGSDAGFALGTGADVVIEAPRPVASGAAPRDVAVGLSHACVLRADDTLACFGGSFNGERGGRLDARSVPTAVTLPGDVVAFDTGARHTCAVVDVTGARSVYCWGDGSLGQVGVDADGTPGIDLVPQRTVPAPVALTQPPRAVALGVDHTCAIPDVSTSPRRAECWGSDVFGQFGDGNALDTGPGPTLSLSLSGPGDAYVISAGRGFTCTLTGGAARCWGRSPTNLGTALGPADRPAPGVLRIAPGVSALSASALDVGDEAACFVATDRLWCFGQNPTPALPLGPSGQVDFPVDPEVAAADPAGLAVVQVSVGARHMCVIDADDQLFCRGDNTFGQVGGDAPPGTFVEVQGLGRVTAVAAGARFTCAIASEELHCWGHDFAGRTGSGRALEHATPQPVVFAP